MFRGRDTFKENKDYIAVFKLLFYGSFCVHIFLGTGNRNIHIDFIAVCIYGIILNLLNLGAG